MVGRFILGRKTGIIWELSLGTSKHSFSHFEDLHFAFLRKTWWWRERQLQDGRGREVTLNRSIKTQAEANTIDTNHKSHITCEHFLGPDKIWETKPTQTACDSLPDTPRY
jgi:hypothetical protein